MTTLFEAMNTTAQTLNGADTNYSSLSACVDLFYQIGSARNMNIIPTFAKALEEDADKAIRILLWSRDIRGGAGERETFRKVVKWLAENKTEFLDNILGSRKIPELGRWDDLLSLVGTMFEPFVAGQIENALTNGDQLCAKWMPRKGANAVALRKALGWTPKRWRKTLVNLSNTVEQKMCSNRWKEIYYPVVPSIAAKQYQKAFMRHDEEGYTKYREGLETGETKINAGAIFPHDIVKSVLHGDKKVADAQWKALPDYLKGTKERILPVVDVSGSMYTTIGKSKTECMDVSIALGLYLSERLGGAFKDMFITFSENPQMQQVIGDNLSSRVQQLRNADWGMNTNIKKVFQLILKKAQEFELPESEMPSTILILSDMEFDSCAEGQNFHAMKCAYNRSGYIMPNIVFWNLNAREGNVPVTVNDKGVALVSGFSPSIMTSLLGGEDMSPEGIMNKTIMKDRYSWK